MNAENFKNYLNDPSLLYQVPYEELKSLALEYPYNAHLRWLLLEKSRMDHRPDVKKALAKAAVYSIDRRALYRFVQKQYEKTEAPLFVFNEDFLELKDLSAIKEELTESLEEAVIPRSTTPIQALRESPGPLETDHDHDEDLVFDFSSKTPAIDEPEATTAPETSLQEEVAASEVAVTDSKVEEEYRAALAAAEAVLEKAAQFTTGAPMAKSSFRSWSRPAPLPSKAVHEPQSPQAPVAKPEKKPKKSDVVSEIARQSVMENEDLISETLADLLAAQQQNEKAIKMYERLILKFPKKSAYFASKIEKLKKK